MKTKALKIIGEELKKEGLAMAEADLEKTLDVIFEKAMPRIVAEDENVAIKSVAGFLAMAWPTVESSIDKAIDFDKDGK